MRPDPHECTGVLRLTPERLLQQVGAVIGEWELGHLSETEARRQIAVILTGRRAEARSWSETDQPIGPMKV